MGDISELRGLLVVGTFLIITVMLITWIPGEFYTLAEGRETNIPEYFESADIAHLNFTYQIDITSSDYELFWGKPEFGHDMRFRATQVGGVFWLWNEHGYRFLGVWSPSGVHRQEWINDKGVNRGDTLFEDEIEEDMGDGATAKYTVRCSHFYMQCFIAYNTSAWPNVHTAWANNDLHLLFGIEWDQRGTTWDAWSLVTGILFFQLPQINFYLNAIIAVPLWIAVAYISFILVLRAIGAIFGGGA